MCIGVPMQVVEQRAFSALCRGRSGEQLVETLLIGPQPVGTWILNFLGTAREVIDEVQAQQILRAMDAVAALERGESEIDIDAHFADLLDPARPPGGFKPVLDGD